MELELAFLWGSQPALRPSCLHPPANHPCSSDVAAPLEARHADSALSKSGVKNKCGTLSWLQSPCLVHGGLEAGVHIWPKVIMGFDNWHVNNLIA
jgi:hypothetical protein